MGRVAVRAGGAGGGAARAGWLGGAGASAGRMSSVGVFAGADGLAAVAAGLDVCTVPVAGGGDASCDAGSAGVGFGCAKSVSPDAQSSPQATPTNAERNDALRGFFSKQKPQRSGVGCGLHARSYRNTGRRADEQPIFADYSYRAADPNGCMPVGRTSWQIVSERAKRGGVGGAMRRRLRLRRSRRRSPSFPFRRGWRPRCPQSRKFRRPTALPLRHR